VLRPPKEARSVGAGLYFRSCQAHSARASGRALSSAHQRYHDIIMP
jgi:hypothetical protein